MVDKEFTIKIRIDGTDSAQEAGKLRSAIESELGNIEISTDLDTRTANAIKRMFEYAGKESEHLERAAEALRSISDIDAGSIEAIHAAMLSIKQDAKGIGKSMAEGMQENWDRLAVTLANVQSQITGIVTPGSEIAGELEGGLPGLSEHLGENAQKAVTAMQKIQEYQGRVKGLTEEIGKLSSERFQPLSGGRTTTLDDLFEGFTNPGKKSWYSRVRNKINRELDALTEEVAGRVVNVRDEIERRAAIGREMRDLAIGGMESEKDVQRVQAYFDRIGAQVNVSQEGLQETMSQVRDAIQEHMAIKPDKDSLEFEEWEEYRQRLVQVMLEIDKEISVAKGSVYDPESLRLMNVLQTRKKELEDEHAGNIDLWKEFAMDSIEEVQLALEREGQTNASQTISAMLKLQERVKDVQGKIRRQYKKLEQGGTAELPEGSSGTLVDFITAEKAMGSAVEDTIEIIQDQIDIFGKLVDAIDEAAKAAQGMSYIERRGSLELEAAARREISKRTRASVPMDQAAENTRDVITRLAKHIDSLRGIVGDPLEEIETDVKNSTVALDRSIEKIEAELSQIQEATEEEIESLPRAGISIEDATKNTREVLQRLNSEIAKLREAATKPIETADAQAESVVDHIEESVSKIETELDRDPTESAGKKAKGLVAVWQWVSDKLVGHSIVPDMVDDINHELERIDVRPLREIKEPGIVGYPTKSDFVGAGFYNDFGQPPEMGNAMLKKHSSAWWMAYTNSGVSAHNSIQDVVRETSEVIDNTLFSTRKLSKKTAARAYLDEWSATADELVGHSIIPEMVNDINSWLEKIDPSGFMYDKMTAEAHETASAVTESLAGLADSVPVDKMVSRINDLQSHLKSLTHEYQDMAMSEGSDPRRVQEFNEAWEEAEHMRWDMPEDAAAKAEGKLPKGFGYSYSTENLTEGSEDDYYSVISTNPRVKKRYSPEESQRLDEIMREEAIAESQLATLIKNLYARREQVAQKFESLSANMPTGGDEAAMQLANMELEELYRELEKLDVAIGDLDTTSAQNIEEASQDLERAILNLEGTEDVVVAQQEEKDLEEQRVFNRSPEAAAIKEAERRKTEIVKSEARLRLESARAARERMREEERRATVEQREQEKQKTINVRQEYEKQKRLLIAMEVEIRESEKRATIETREQEKQRTIAIRQEYESRKRLVAALEAKVKETERRRTASEKAQLRSKEREAKLIIQAQKIAAELGEDWETIHAEMKSSGLTAAEMVGHLRKQKKEAAQLARETAQLANERRRAQELTTRLGLSWQYVEEKMNQTGISMRDAIRQLQIIDDRQKKVDSRADRIREDYEGIAGTVKLFREEVNASGKESEGLTLITRNLQTAADNLGRTAVVIKGSLMMAGRDYLQFTKELDRGARALGLSKELSEDLRETVRQQSTETGIDPQQLAVGITSFAQDANVAIENTEQLNQLLENTKPLQDAVAMTGVDITTMVQSAAAAINQYGKSIEDTEYITAVFNKVADETLASVGDVANAFKFAGPSAQRANESLEATAASLYLLGKSGIKASQAGTSYQRMLTNLMVPASEKAKETLKDLFGTTEAFYSSNGEFVGTAKAILDRKAQELASTSLSQWDTQRSQLEDSESQRLARLQQQWTNLWLTIGQQGIELVLPVVENAGRFLEKLNTFVDNNPQLVKAVATTAASGIVLSRLLAATSQGIRTIELAKNLADGAWGVLKFKGSVITSGELFRASVTKAAAAQTLATKASAGKTTAMLTASTTTHLTFMEGLRGVLTVAIAGLKAVALFVAKVILGPLAAIAGGGLIYEKVIKDKIGGASLGEYASVAAHAAGSVVEKLGGREGLAEEWFRGVAEKTGAIESPETTGTPSGDDVLGRAGIWLPGTDQLRGLETEIDNLGKTAFDTSAELYRQGEAMRENASINVDLSPEQESAVDHYIELMEKQKDAVEDFNTSLADNVRDLHADLADIDQKYRDDVESERSQFNQQQAERLRQHQEDKARALDEHNKRMRRMEEDHDSRMWDLTLSRDAAGLYKEKANYKRDRSRAEEDFAEQQSQKDEQFRREQEQTAAQNQQRLADLANQHQLERTRRLEEHQRRVEELRTQHEQDMNRIKKEYFDRINSELNYFKRSKDDRNRYYSAMLVDAEEYLKANRAIWQNYIANLPTPTQRNQPRNGIRARAAGGYIDETKPYMMHAGEFVMSPATTRQVEAGINGRLNQQNVKGGNEVHINAQFTGMGPQDHGWFEEKLQDFQRELATQLQ